MKRKTFFIDAVGISCVLAVAFVALNVMSGLLSVAGMFVESMKGEAS
jgi:hypothetical protein